MTILLRKPQVLNMLGIGKSHLHDQIKKGLLPPPVSIGARSVAWPDYEIEKIAKALIAGLTDVEIKNLVKSLVLQRSQRIAG
jgi:prophage regulatory protein